MGYIRNIPWGWISSQGDVTQGPPFVTESEFSSWCWSLSRFVNYVPKRSPRRMMELLHKPAQILFHLYSTLSQIQAKLNVQRHWNSCVLLFPIAVILFTPVKTCFIFKSLCYQITMTYLYIQYIFMRVNLFPRTSNSHYVKTLSQLLGALYYNLEKTFNKINVRRG